MNSCARGPGSSVTTCGTTASRRSTGIEVVGVGIITYSCSVFGRSRRRLPRGRPPWTRRDGWEELGPDVQQPGFSGGDAAGQRGVILGADAVDRLGVDAEPASDGDEVDRRQVAPDVLAFVAVTQHPVAAVVEDHDGE